MYNVWLTFDCYNIILYGSVFATYTEVIILKF